MCKKFIQGLLGGKQRAVAPPAVGRSGGDEGGEALVLAPEAVEAGTALQDPNGGRVRLSGGARGGGGRVAGLSI